MRVYKITKTGSGSGTQTFSPAVMDLTRNPFNVSIALNTGGSTTTATVQYTFDDLGITTAANAVWFTHPDFSAVTVDTVGNVAFPVTGIRLVLGATGTDTWDFWVIQAG